MRQVILDYYVNELGTYLFIPQGGFHGILRRKGENDVTLPQSAQRKHAFLGKTNQMLKPKKIAPRKNVALELLHHTLGHISTRSFMDGDTVNVWKDIELRIDSYPFCTSCHIYSMNKKDISKNLLKPKAPFKWVFTDIISATASKS